MLTYKAQHILSLVWSSSLAHESPSTVVANYRLDGTVMRRAGKIYWHAANTGLTFRSYTPHNASLILRKSCGAAMVAFVGTFFWQSQSICFFRSPFRSYLFRVPEPL
jgi:hypothetical protein